MWQEKKTIFVPLCLGEKAKSHNTAVKKSTGIFFQNQCLHGDVSRRLVQHVPQVFVCVCLCVCSCTVSWYLEKKCVILCEPPCIWQGSQTDRLGCTSAISSAWLPERFSLAPTSSARSFLPPSHLPINVLQWGAAGRGIFFLHLPYLASCTGRRSPWIKPTQCSITVPSTPHA